MIEFTMTADLHLHDGNAGDGLEVLRWICRHVRERGSDGLLVGGDLFDSHAAGRDLAGAVDDLFREELDDRPVVMVAGNHDENLAELGWTGEVTVLGEGESATLRNESASLVVHGLPYLRGRDVYRPGEPGDEPAETHVLLAHASYLTPRHAHLLEWLGEEEENAFLLHEEDLRDSGYDHVLLGHWHGHQPLGGEPPATYAGSPIPASRRETGPRGILDGTLSEDGLRLEPVPVECPPGWFHEVRRGTVVPGHEDAFLEDLERDLPEPNPGCVLLLEVDGYTAGEPASFRRRLEERVEEWTDGFREINVNAGELQQAESLEAPMLRRLLEALEERPPGERLSVGDVVNDEEPDRVHEAARTLLHEEPDELVGHARRLLLRAVCEVMDA